MQSLTHTHSLARLDVEIPKTLTDDCFCRIDQCTKPQKIDFNWKLFDFCIEMRSFEFLFIRSVGRIRIHNVHFFRRLCERSHTSSIVFALNRNEKNENNEQKTRRTPAKGP